MIKKVLLLLIILFSCTKKPEIKAERLYWFIPDGMRADPDLFKIYQWANDGSLPNIKRLINEGSFGYSIPDFPSHTPTNFASLLTGSTPDIHGIADGPMHTEGYPLKRPSAPGFSSGSKKVPAAWKTFESQGKKVALLSIPGSTPPEISGLTIRGRWGGWGLDSSSIVYVNKRQFEDYKKFGRGFRLFFLGPKLTQFVPSRPIDSQNSDAPLLKSKLSAYGADVSIEVFDSKKDLEKKYDKIKVRFPGGEIFTIGNKEQTPWVPIELIFKNTKVNSNAKLSVIDLKGNADFRVKLMIDNLNRFVVSPPEYAQVLSRNLGPMVDFADNWPPQLIYDVGDKDQFLSEMRQSTEWHKNAASHIWKDYSPDVFIHDIYTPNQMLESRWWHQFINKDALNFDKGKAKSAWKDIKEMYIRLDAIIGKVLEKADRKKDMIVLSSDHGVCPLKKLVKLNNLFGQKGWLKFEIDKETGEPSIDWKNTKVIYLKMAHIYINPNGLDGNWKRAKGQGYEKLRAEVIKTLLNLKDSDGFAPVANALEWEKASQNYQLPSDRIGDIVIETKVPYFWFEEVDESLDIFVNPMTSGFKQTTDPLKNKCMWTPFIVWGPNIKKGHRIQDPINHVDQLPTILRAMKLKDEKHMNGTVIDEVFND
jgi:predicted AlkP superfamily phosphohydrolase/phosphomutase